MGGSIDDHIVSYRIVSVLLLLDLGCDDFRV